MAAHHRNELEITFHFVTLDEGSGQVIVDSSTLAANGVLGTTTAVEPEDPQWASNWVMISTIMTDDFESGGTTTWSVTVP